MTRVVTHEYADADFRGIPWKRPTRSTTQLVAEGGTSTPADVTEYLAYDDEGALRALIKRGQVPHIARRRDASCYV